MWFVLFASNLLAHLFTPGSINDVLALLPIDDKSVLISFVHRVRGRVLASSLKKGMTDREVGECLGLPAAAGGNRNGRFEAYPHLGLIVSYAPKDFTIVRETGEKEVRTRWVISGASIAPLLKSSVPIRLRFAERFFAAVDWTP